MQQAHTQWHLGMKTAAYLPSSRGFDKYFGYYLGCTDYWKHYSKDGGLDLHEGGSLLGLEPGKDRPIYNTSGQYAIPIAQSHPSNTCNFASRSSYS